LNYARKINDLAGTDPQFWWPFGGPLPQPRANFI